MLFPVIRQIKKEGGSLGRRACGDRCRSRFVYAVRINHDGKPDLTANSTGPGEMVAVVLLENGRRANSATLGKKSVRDQAGQNQLMMTGTIY